MKKVLARLLWITRNPALRPVEVWVLRAVYAYIAVKFGLDVKGIAR